MPTISFPTSNFVGRAMRYAGPLDWPRNEEATLTWSNPDRFLEIVQNVVTAGIEAIDIWSAHCHWQRHDREDYLEQVKGLCSQFDLTIASYTGQFELNTAKDIDAPFKFMKQLGAPLFAGQIISSLSVAELMAIINQACLRYGAKYAFINDAENSIDEILQRIDNANHDRAGVALDTGWCGARGINALDAIKRLQDAQRLFAVHLKDVKAVGDGETCTLGEGIVPCEQIARHLAQSNWKGTISIGHEPFDRDPMDEIETGLDRLRQWLK